MVGNFSIAINFGSQQQIVRKYASSANFLPSIGGNELRCFHGMSVKLKLFDGHNTLTSVRMPLPKTHHLQIDLCGYLGVCDVNGRKAHYRHRYLEDDTHTGLPVPIPLRIIAGGAGVGPVSTGQPGYVLPNCWGMRARRCYTSTTLISVRKRKHPMTLLIKSGNFPTGLTTQGATCIMIKVPTGPACRRAARSNRPGTLLLVPSALALGSHMHLKQAEIQNFRGISSRQVSFTDRMGAIRPVSVIAGPNGSGKTSILYAIVQALRGVMGYRNADVPEASDDDIYRSTPSGQRITVATAKLHLHFDQDEMDAIDLFLKSPTRSENMRAVLDSLPQDC